MDDANPYIGKIGEKKRLKKKKSKLLYQAQLRNKVLKAMLKAHPYEEPAYDLLCLIKKQMNLVLDGLVNLDEKMTLEQFAERCKTAFNVPAVRFVGDPT